MSRERVSLTETVDCPECGAVSEQVYVLPEGVWEAQDIEEPPSTTMTCPCGAVTEITYSGWSNYGDA